MAYSKEAEAAKAKEAEAARVKELEKVQAKVDKEKAAEAAKAAANPVIDVPGVKQKVTSINFGSGDRLAFPFTPQALINGTFQIEQHPEGPHDFVILVAVGDDANDFQNAVTYLGWTTHGVQGTPANALRVLEAGKTYSLNFMRIKIGAAHPVPTSGISVIATLFN